MEQRLEQFTGPLPPPEVLIRYNDAFPGCAERIVAMAESQVSHRQGLEARTLNGKLSNERTGQWMAFVLAGIGIVGSIVLMALGRWGEGSTVLLTTVVSLVGIFIWGRRRQGAELKEKAQATFGPRNP
ncbi:MAG: DUF2335 domain-containing protein [Anaerolineales bacterium]